MLLKSNIDKSKTKVKLFNIKHAAVAAQQDLVQGGHCSNKQTKNSETKTENPIL